MDAHVHLDSLNPAQRRAVSLGDGAAPAPPLLIIAGAGSGKTNTLAHRVAHLMVPQRFFTHGQSSTGDRHVYAARTRFVPDDLLKHFERRAWPLASPAGGERPLPGPGSTSGRRCAGRGGSCGAQVLGLA